MENIEKIFNKQIAQGIINSVKAFAKEYAELNETPFLEDIYYQDKLNELVCIINKSEELQKLIKSGEINIEKIAFASSEELNPEKFGKITKQKKEERYNKDNKEGVKIYKCPKCKKNNSSVEQKQTRRGDEAPTTIITCLECGHKYRL